MTFQAVGSLYLPRIPRGGLNFIADVGATAAHTLSASGAKMGCIFWPAIADTIDLIGFRTGTVTTGDTLKVSVQDLLTTADDVDEVIDAFRTIVIADGDDNVYKETGLITSDGTDTGTKKSVSPSSPLGVVFEFDAFVAGNLQLLALDGATRTTDMNSAYITIKSGGTWSTPVNEQPYIVVKYTSGIVQEASLFPAVSLTQPTFGSGSTPDEIGLLISGGLPFGFRVMGCWGALERDGDMDMVLYEGSTSKRTLSLDTDNRGDLSLSIGRWAFSTPYDFPASTDCRIVMKPGATSIGYELATFSDATHVKQWTGFDTIYRTERTDGGSFSQTTTQLPIIGLWISHIDIPSGGGTVYNLWE